MRTAAIVTAAVGVLALAAVMVAAITVLSALAHLMVLLLVAFAGGAAL